MTVGRPAGASGGAQWSRQVRREREGEQWGLRPGKESVREETVRRCLGDRRQGCVTEGRGVKIGSVWGPGGGL